MIIELNVLFQKWYPEQLKFRGRYKSKVVYGKSIDQVFRKLLLVAFSNNN